MKILKAEFEILTPINSEYILTSLEKAGRTCYKSEKEITFDTAKKFVSKLIKKGHESVVEHQSISVKIVCDRGISHELVRHRLASYSQESQRYCNYKDDIIFILPCWIDINCIGNEDFNLWYEMCEQSESNYKKLISIGWNPEEARCVLNNSVKTELVMTANLREWRHFFKLRAEELYGRPHPQMLEITIPMLEKFKKLIPVIFDNIGVTNS